MSIFICILQLFGFLLRAAARNELHLRCMNWLRHDNQIKRICARTSERVQIAPRRLDEGERSAKHQTERLRRKGVIAYGMNWLRHEIPTGSFASLEDDTSGSEAKNLRVQIL